MLAFLHRCADKSEDKETKRRWESPGSTDRAELSTDTHTQHTTAGGTPIERAAWLSNDFQQQWLRSGKNLTKTGTDERGGAAGYV